MNKKTNHNSIIFLTTLSVYLGLVLVGGATPMVLGKVNNLQADFLCKDLGSKECDYSILKEEADKRFSKLGLSEGSVRVLASDIDNAFEDDDLKGSFEIDLLLNFSLTGNVQYKLALETDKVYDGSNQSRADELFEKAAGIAENFGRNSCVAGQKKCVPLQLKANLNSEGFYVEVNFPLSSNKNAEEFVKAYQFLIDAEVCWKRESGKNDFSKLLVDNTIVSSENNQVFIVTRLPRASLDALPAEKDAQ